MMRINVYIFDRFPCPEFDRLKLKETFLDENDK